MANTLQGREISLQRAANARRTRILRERLATGSVYLVLSLGALAMLVPFFWQISTSLKDDVQVNTVPPRWIPNPIHLDNYVTAFTALPFNLFFLNTMIIEVGVLVGILLTSTMVAYGFARFEAPGKSFLFLIVLSTMMLPGIITLVPTYFIFVKLHWVDTLLPLIVPAFFGGGASISSYCGSSFSLSPGSWARRPSLMARVRWASCSASMCHWPSRPWRRS